MLRDKPTRTERSRWRRSIVIGVTVVATVVVSGLRRPDSGEAIAQTPATATVPAASVAQADAFNLDNVPSSEVIVAGIRPSKVAANDGMQQLVKLVEESTGAEKNDIRIADIDQFLVIGPRRPNVDTPSIAEAVLELRMTKPTDFAAFLEHHIGAHSSEDQTVDGFKIVTKHSPVKKHSPCAYIVDDRTLLFGPWYSLQELLQSRRQADAGPHWLDRLNMVARRDALFGFDVSFLEGEMEQQFQRRPNPMLGMVSPLWQNTQQVIAGANLDEGLSLNVHGFGDDEVAAEKIQLTLQNLIPIANGLLTGGKASVQDGEDPEKKAIMKAIEIAEEVMQSMKVTRDGKKVSINAAGDGDSVAALTALLLPALHSARESARRAQGRSNLKQIMLTLHNYHQSNGSFPPAVLTGPDGKTKYSWRVALLPYMDQHQLYEAYDRNEPWDGPNNRKLLGQIPAVLRSAKEPQGSPNTSYFALVGEHTGFGNTPGTGRKTQDFTDGLSRTLMVFETKLDVPWTKPEDIPYSADEPLPKFGGLHDFGFQVGLADGAVRFVSENIDLTVLRELITCDGGEVVNF